MLDRRREQPLEGMAAYPGYGEQRSYSDALGTEQLVPLAADAAEERSSA